MNVAIASKGKYNNAKIRFAKYDNLHISRRKCEFMQYFNKYLKELQ